MNKSLNAHLEQISRLISGLRDDDIDLKKLTELDRSLDLLSHKIKTVRLDNYSPKQIPQTREIRQDAVFYFDNDFKVVRFIGEFENIFGRRLKNDTFPRMDALMDNEGFNEFKKRTEILYETGESQSFSSRIISQNGISLPGEILLEKVKFSGDQELFSAGVVFFNETFSDLEDYREILLENLPGIDVFLFDTNFRHVLAGGNEKKRFGLSNTDFSGKTLFEVYDEKTQKRLYPFYRNALDGKISEGEVRIRNEVFFVSVTPVYGINKKVVGGALISQNVTQEKEVEKNLIKARREAEEADKAKSLFLANMSHEIRTPLNAIIGFTGLLNKTELDPKQQKYADLISQSSEHLLSVVNEVLFLFKLGMGRVMVEKTPFHIRKALNSVKESFQMRAAEKNLGFHFSIDEKLPDGLVGDQFRLKQILINIITNAIKYTDQGEINVRVLVEKQTSRKVFVRFEVEDTGIGISKDNIDTIFEIFSQPGVKSKKANRGAGLGLTIVQKLVDLLDGRLHVESELGAGSEFSVVIPFLIAKKNEKFAEENEYDIEFNQLKGKRILYADDDENNLLLGKSILSDWEIDYKVARDGAEAFEFLKTEEFDMVLLDIHMPLLSGVEVVKKIRKRKQSPNRYTKILAVTANVMENDLKNYLSSGFDDYVLKPFSEDTLYIKICQLLEIEPGGDLMVTGKKTLSPAGNEKKDGTGKDSFDTSELLKTTAGNEAFFNQMLGTFIKNATDTADSFERMARTGDWEGIGQKAHKAIPSFRYFKLDNLVSNLTQLEELGLHKKDFGPMKPLTAKTVKGIHDILKQAEEAKNTGKLF
ncbi:MAG: ATP-binding protein [Tangfeifania sp.]